MCVCVCSCSGATWLENVLRDTVRHGVILAQRRGIFQAELGVRYADQRHPCSPRAGDTRHGLRQKAARVPITDN